MKKYTIPTLEITRISSDEVITTSGGGLWELPPVEFEPDSYEPSNTDRG